MYIYAHFQKWSRWNIIGSVHDDLNEMYKKKRLGCHKNINMTDTSIITNKCGSDFINRNPLVKNKNCSKILNIADDKGVSLFLSFLQELSMIVNVYY